MKHPQVINMNEDVVIAIDGLNVIDNTTEALMSDTESTIQVDGEFLDLMTGAHVSLTNETITYQSESDTWTIDVSDLPALVDRHKYIARITTALVPLEAANMRPFKLNEFAVDNDSFEAVWMRLPYQVVIAGTPKIIWYEDITWAVPLYEALAYEGGVGTTPATDPSRVTHRGAITVV